MNNFVGNKSFERVEKKIKLLGYNISPKSFIIIRLVGSLILFVALLFCKYGFILAPVFTILYYVLLEVFILDLSIKRRRKILEEDALEYIPLIQVSLKNNDLFSSIENVSSVVSNRLSSVFTSMVNRYKLGIDSLKVLEETKESLPSNTLISMVDLFLDHEKYGRDINDELENLLNVLRESKERKRLIKYKLVSFEIAFLSVLFVFIVAWLFIIVK